MKITQALEEKQDTLNGLGVQLSFPVTRVNSKAIKENIDKSNYIKIKLLWQKPPQAIQKQMIR